MNYKKQLEDLILNVIHEDGSDLHLGVGRVPAIRVSGELIFLLKYPEFTKEDMVGVLKEVLDEKKVERFMENQEMDFSYDFRGEARLRGNAFFQKGFINIAFRLIPKVKSLSDLHLPPIISDIARKKQGFFLVVGPVGQGKSTTISSMINLINTEQTKHIVTIEDPIEFMYNADKSIINQREVGIDTKDFHIALGSVFREDVNVIMIGEMRTPETIAIAVTAAETGHLVFATLHTNSASQTIYRIVDTFPSGQQSQIRAQLSGSLLGIVSQRLIPRIAGGLIPACEIMMATPATANLIRENKIHELPLVIETSIEAGMISLNRSLAILVKRKEISLQNALSYSLNPSELKMLTIR